jgi:hypothetical protein
MALLFNNGVRIDLIESLNLILHPKTVQDVSIWHKTTATHKQNILDLEQHVTIIQNRLNTVKADNAKLRAGIQKLKQAGNSEMKRRAAIIELIQMIDTNKNDGKQSELEM